MPVVTGQEYEQGLRQPELAPETIDMPSEATDEAERPTVALAVSGRVRMFHPDSTKACSISAEIEIEGVKLVIEKGMICVSERIADILEAKGYLRGSVVKEDW